ncbi:YSC84-related protein [Flavobacterium sp. ARAG 55.4]|uniref:Lipid-binding SYLF domain-containing protein n=1 Tax=Flavobacterium plantiphilum TaxID=3163297 RepID=A0ABW8XSM5_9FLAO
MKTLKKIILTGLLLVTVGVMAQNKKDTQIMNDAEKAKEMILSKNMGLKKFFKEASGYAIFPNVGKGGFVIGGASGNGVVYENGTAIGMTSLKKVNIGLQAGGQALIEVIFFQTEAALAKFKQGNYEFSAEMSAVAADKGEAENASYKDGVVVFALPKAGLMVDASVGGQKFEYHPFKK